MTTDLNAPFVSQVTYLNKLVDKDFVVKLFSKLAIKYGKLWTERLGVNGDWIACTEDWAEELSKFSLGEATAAVSKCLSMYKEFPPTQGQLIDLCLKETGLPEPNDIIRLMIAKDFCHPLVKMCYDKIGNWALANSKDYEIREKVKALYPGLLADFQISPQEQWARLQDLQDMKRASLPAPDKNPTPGESQAFRDCMEKCREILGVKLSSEEKTPHREFEEENITPTNRSFDPKVYDEFRDYLLSIPETMTFILPPRYAYRRMKFMAAKEQPNFLRKQGYNPNPPPPDKEPPRRYGGPYRVHKNFYGD